MNDDSVLSAAHRHASGYLATVGQRPVAPVVSAAQSIARLGCPLPVEPTDPSAVIDQLARDADCGVVASAGPRYFGFVTGGAVPVTVAAEWLGSAWDQN